MRGGGEMLLSRVGFLRFVNLVQCCLEGGGLGALAGGVQAEAHIADPELLVVRGIQGQLRSE